MRTYTLRGHEFEGFELFIAAKRDLEKLDDFNIEGEAFFGGEISLDTAVSVMERVEREHITFETELGRNFLDRIREKISTAKEEEVFRQKEKPKRSINKGKLVRNIILISLLVAMGIAALMLYFNLLEEEEFKAQITRLRNQKDHFASEETVAEDGAILPEYAALHESNKDMWGWLSIDYTAIDYPVMFRVGDNDYYLNRDFEGEYDQNGMIFMDGRCDPSGEEANILIHGHNMNSGMMFGGLRKYLDRGYYEDHKIINYDTLYEKRTYVIISVFTSSVDSEESGDFRYYDYINISSKNDFNEYVSGVKAASMYDTGETAAYGDRLITLSTCEYSKDGGRLVIVGRELKYD